ncbi:MAG: hypothetical protein ACO1QR_06970 [Chthoniobacteraceae bacterium]
MSAAIFCPPLGTVSVEWDRQAFGASQRSRDQLQVYWPNLWVGVYEAVQNVVREYEHEEQFKRASKRLVVGVPNFEENGEAEWHISIHTDPFAGVVDVAMRGHLVTDVGVSF